MKKLALTLALEGNNVNLYLQVITKIRPIAMFPFHWLTAPFLDLVFGPRKEQNSFSEELKVQGRRMM